MTDSTVDLMTTDADTDSFDIPGDVLNMRHDVYILCTRGVLSASSYLMRVRAPTLARALADFNDPTYRYTMFICHSAQTVVAFLNYVLFGQRPECLSIKRLVKLSSIAADYERHDVVNVAVDELMRLASTLPSARQIIARGYTGRYLTDVVAIAHRTLAEHGELGAAVRHEYLVNTGWAKRPELV